MCSSLCRWERETKMSITTLIRQDEHFSNAYFALLGRCSKSENRQKIRAVKLKKKCAVKTFQRSNKECLTKNSIYSSFYNLRQLACTEN